MSSGTSYGSLGRILLDRGLITSGQLEDALDSMDRIDREVLAMRHFEELTNNEIAQVLGITKSAASNRYVRALGRLKAVLEEVPGFFDEEDVE